MFDPSVAYERVSFMKILSSICALDCPDACSLKITVDKNRVVKLEGDADHPVTQGFACVKTYRYPERQEHPDRLLYPMRRIGKKGEGRFARCSWDEALDAIAIRLKENLERHGPESLVPYCYAGTMGQVEGGHALALFRALGARELDQTICATTGSAGWEMNYGPNKLGPSPEDVVHAKLIILWGINSLRSSSHLTPFVKEARKRGAFVLHIDPYRNETSRFADEHWQIRVGTDAALALAIGNYILAQGWEDRSYLASYASGLDEYRSAASEWSIDRAAEYCGLDADRIRQFAQSYAQSECSYLRVGYGMTRNEGGGNAMRAITLLPALTGAWKKRGGGACLSTSGAFPLNKTRVGGNHLMRPGVRHLNMNLLGEELHSGDIHSLVVFNSNPAAVAPDSSQVRAGLSREDLFTVVLEHFQTDTADYADYLLPATTFLEHSDLYTSYGHYYLQWSEPVVTPRGEAKPNTWIFAQLARRLGLQDASLYWTAEQVAEALLDTSHPWMKGVTLEKLKEQRSIRLALPETFTPYAEGSHFPDKKIRFSPAPQQLTFEEQPSEEYPYRLISPPGAYILNTTMGNLESIRKMAGGQPQVIIHPKDAQGMGIVDRSMVQLRSPQGTIVRQAIVSEDTPPKTIIALGQWWPKLAPDKKSLNDLTSQRLTDLGGGSTFGNPVVACQPWHSE